jgi:hypothetical protein
MITLATPKGKVCGGLGQPKLADQEAVRVIAVQAVMSRSPETTEMIKSDSVVTLVVSTEHFPTGQRSMINIEKP